MKQTLKGAVTGLALFGASTAFAINPGDPLYIKAKDTKVLKTATATGAAVVTLQPGAEVQWQAVDKTDPKFHKVKSGAKEGFVLMANLSMKKPQDEVASDGKPILGHAVASSGAATRALSRSGQNYANSKGPEAKVAGQQVVLVEGINFQANKDSEPAAAGKKKKGGK